MVPGFSVFTATLVVPFHVPAAPQDTRVSEVERNGRKGLGFVACRKGLQGEGGGWATLGEGGRAACCTEWGGTDDLMVEIFAKWLCSVSLCHTCRNVIGGGLHVLACLAGWNQQEKLLNSPSKQLEQVNQKPTPNVLKENNQRKKVLCIVSVGENIRRLWESIWGQNFEL